MRCFNVEMKECLFCQLDKIKSDILWESENFFVKVGVGILAPGHIMIIPKIHISCFGQLPKQLHKEFILIKKDVFDKIKSNFFEPIIYEHGIYSQSIKHAHLHFLPSRNEYYHMNNIKENLFKSLKSTQIRSIFQIKNVFKKEGSYFYLEQNNRKWVFHTKGQEDRKFTFRKEFARISGLHCLTDWQTMPKEQIQRDKIWVGITKDIFRVQNEE